MHDKNQPKVKIPSRTTWQGRSRSPSAPFFAAQPGGKAVLVFSYEISCWKLVLGMGRAVIALAKCIPARAGLGAGPNQRGIGLCLTVTPPESLTWSKEKPAGGWCYGACSPMRLGRARSPLWGFISWHTWVKSAVLFWYFPGRLVTYFQVWLFTLHRCSIWGCRQGRRSGPQHISHGVQATHHPSVLGATVATVRTWEQEQGIRQRGGRVCFTANVFPFIPLRIVLKDRPRTLLFSILGSNNIPSYSSSLPALGKVVTGLLTWILVWEYSCPCTPLL